MIPGHIVSCYKEVKTRLPLNIVQLFRDVTSFKGWLEPGLETESVKITISGENLIEHDLPRKKNVKSNKKPT